MITHQNIDHCIGVFNDSYRSCTIDRNITVERDFEPVIKMQVRSPVFRKFSDRYKKDGWIIRKFINLCLWKGRSSLFLPKQVKHDVVESQRSFPQIGCR